MVEDLTGVDDRIGNRHEVGPVPPSGERSRSATSNPPAALRMSCGWSRCKINISALTGRHVDRLGLAIKEALAGWETRISTGRLNAFLGRIVAAHPHPVRGGKQPRILFATQARAAPPTFVLFTTGQLEPGYLRFLKRRLREEFGFQVRRCIWSNECERREGEVSGGDVQVSDQQALVIELMQALESGVHGEELRASSTTMPNRSSIRAWSTHALGVAAWRA